MNSRGSSRQEDYCKYDGVREFSNVSSDDSMNKISGEKGLQGDVVKSHDETTRELKQVLKKLEDMVVSQNSSP